MTVLRVPECSVSTEMTAQAYSILQRKTIVSEPVLVTGCAGFIGFHTAAKLLDMNRRVVGIDNVNAYYSQHLKRDRLSELAQRPGFTFSEVDLSNSDSVAKLVATHRPLCVVHLAAQAGVRWSIENPKAFIDSNIVGFLSVLEACRHHAVEHLIYASSSSVYGANTKLPFSVGDTVDHPLSLYAATKKANELLAHSYSHLYRLPTTGLRFFTIYGPWGRPDMAIWKFTKAILTGEPVELYNHGHMRRDFTYIDDVVESIVRLTEKPATANPLWNSDRPDPGTSDAPWRIYNIGNRSPVELLHVVELLEENLGRKAIRHLVDIQPGDVPATYADIDALANAVGFSPATPIEVGIKRFVDWYREYHSHRPDTIAL